MRTTLDLPDLEEGYEFAYAALKGERQCLL